jgi:SAM-dependent methyltransferase
VYFRKIHLLESHHGKGAFIRTLPSGGRILDVGCGNDSPAYCKWVRRDLHYIGVDVADYHQEARSIRSADEYHVVTPDRFCETIGQFACTIDGVVSSHNLEHCDDYRDVLKAMVGALKLGGRMYLSFPCEASTRFPRRRGCLNFYDDTTHRNLPPWRGIIEDLSVLGMSFEFRSRRYRPIAPALCGLLYEPISALRGEVMWTGGTWALYGFESVIWARRESCVNPHLSDRTHHEAQSTP